MVRYHLLRARIIVAALLLAAPAVLGGCGVQTTQATNSVGSRQSQATVTPARACPPAWEGWPDSSPAIVGGTVLLPPSTRVIFVDSAPGEADAQLCTVGMTATAINLFMKANLPAKGWDYTTQAARRKHGPVLTFVYTINDPLNWTVECTCGGI